MTCTCAAGNEQKFFGSFFQKRTASFALLGLLQRQRSPKAFCFIPNVLIDGKATRERADASRSPRDGPDIYDCPIRGRPMTIKTILLASAALCTLGMALALASSAPHIVVA